MGHGGGQKKGTQNFWKASRRGRRSEIGAGGAECKGNIWERGTDVFTILSVMEEVTSSTLTISNVPT